LLDKGVGMGNRFHDLSIFIFRRDLRLTDNTGLLAALASSETVIPVFIFDPRQVGSENTFRSSNAIQFMIEALQHLDESLKKRGSKLYVWHGLTHEVTDQLLASTGADAVYVNRDYTPFSRMRDQRIDEICRSYGAYVYSYHDILLHEPEEIETKSGGPYQVFTPFYKNARERTILEPKRNTYRNFYSTHISIDADEIDIHNELTSDGRILTDTNADILTHGDRSIATRTLNSLQQFADYPEERDYPYIDTTHLSAHHKFGTISVRETFHATRDFFGYDNVMTQQLFWRDFYTHIAYNFSHVFGNAFRHKYDGIEWDEDEELFEKWCNGMTGFPIVDAGMRQLNTIGFMHNRVRMIVASFLTKDLHISWQKGEKYFAQHLVDYDPSVNNGNWQWVASTGSDAQPYFRVFNPWTQQEKYDKDCVYIKQWVPELHDLKPHDIHRWYKRKEPRNGYPLPCVDHKKERTEAKKRYKAVV